MLSKVKKVIEEVENTNIYDEQLQILIDSAQLELLQAGIPYTAETETDNKVSNSYVVAVALKVRMLLFPDSDLETENAKFQVITKNLRLYYNS